MLALLTGAGLALAETLINWGQWQWWPWWLVDYVAAGLLAYAALLSWRRAPQASGWLAAAWGFTVAMFWMSLAGNISNGTAPERMERAAGGYVELVALGLAVAIVGLLTALAALRSDY